MTLSAHVTTPMRRALGLMRVGRLVLGMLTVLTPAIVMAQATAQNTPQGTPQGTTLAFKGLQQDPSAPVEIEAESLAVDQQSGLAIFTGNVVVVQGTLVLTAPRIEVTGDPDRGGDGIRDVRASGGVVLRTGQETASGQDAVYDVTTGLLQMDGEVVLTQGTSTISGARLIADLSAGTGTMEGRVRTVFRPAASGGGGN
jgi:lipopolysaccharide export system protein LptA